MVAPRREPRGISLTYNKHKIEQIEEEELISDSDSDSDKDVEDLLEDIVTGWGYDKIVYRKRQILMIDIQESGFGAPYESEHFHRIRMKKLELDEAQINLDTIIGKKTLLDSVDNLEEQLKNYTSWKHFLMIVSTDNGIHTNRILLNFINDKIEEIEGRISELTNFIDDNNLRKIYSDWKIYSAESKPHSPAYRDILLGVSRLGSIIDNSRV